MGGLSGDPGTPATPQLEALEGQQDLFQVELFNKAMSGKSTGRLSRFFGSSNGRASPAPPTPAPSITVDDMLVCQQVRGLCSCSLLT